MRDTEELSRINALTRSWDFIERGVAVASLPSCITDSRAFKAPVDFIGDVFYLGSRYPQALVRLQLNRMCLILPFASKEVIYPNSTADGWGEEFPHSLPLDLVGYGRYWYFYKDTVSTHVCDQILPWA